MTTNNENIQHHTQEGRFTLKIDGEQAVLEYYIEQNPRGNSIIDFTRTYVPPQFRGKGYAEKLVRHGLNWAREQGYEIQASCWYVRAFLRN
jgi:uncharacterized protein